MDSRVGKVIVLAVILSGAVSSAAFAQKGLVSISGRVEDAASRSPLAGVNVLALHSSYGTTTDSLGDFQLNLEPGTYVLSVTCVGYMPQQIRINTVLKSGLGRIIVSLAPAAYTTQEVVVSAKRHSSSPGLYTVKEKDLQYVPNLFSDVLRSVTILPGVSSNNELSSAYNVHGQNFNENLIYLDGFEVYLPYLAQQGIQDNMSIVNENMVRDFKFYNAAFPVQFGDRMSSVLQVQYKNSEDTLLGGEVNADLLNMGLTLHDRIGSLSWIAGIRYAYPSSFTSVLQTKGNYLPRYTDFQFLGSYEFPHRMNLQLLFITARNRFDLTPQDWTGKFQYGEWYNFQELYLKLNGTNSYSYNSNLAGLKLTTPLGSGSSLATSIAYYSDKELYNENLGSNIYFAPSAYDPLDRTFLDSLYQYADNSLTMNRFELKSTFNSNDGWHGTMAGLTLRSSSMNNSLYELTSASSATGTSSLAASKQDFVFNSISGYLGEYLHFGTSLTTHLGLRALKYYFNGQFLVSPRASVSFRPDSSSSLDFGWGYYYQPPSFYETRDKSAAVAKSLLAQRAIHYVVRYNNSFKSGANLMAEVFYEKLSKLIPYSYTNQLELTYGNSNNYEGFAYGLDLEYEAKVAEGLDTWIGYDYLNSKERKSDGSSPYQPSLLDQTNTIRIFLQDAVPHIHNCQAHVRLLFGTGYLYHPMVNAPGTSPTDNPQMVPDYNVVQQYPWYYRVDMGLTYKFVFEKKSTVTLTADVFNVFDNQNIVAYSWYFIPQDSPQPVPIPNMLSERYFNVGAKVAF